MCVYIYVCIYITKKTCIYIYVCMYIGIILINILVPQLDPKQKLVAPPLPRRNIRHHNSQVVKGTPSSCQFQCGVVLYITLYYDWFTLQSFLCNLWKWVLLGPQKKKRTSQRLELDDSHFHLRPGLLILHYQSACQLYTTCLRTNEMKK